MVDKVKFSTSLPSAEMVRRFPSLRRAAVLQQELVQDTYLDLSEQLERNSETFGNDPEAAREAFDVYNRVVKDGRYVSLLATDPAKAAKLSDIALSREALGIIKKAGFAVLPGGGGEVQNPAIAPIAVAVAVAVVTKGSNPMEEIIIDQSGMIKM